jgi:hypothetical protein
MAFLYRLHLVDFDPKDEVQIEKHWKWILQAIRYSSPSLYTKISLQPFAALEQNVKYKIIKYLIRGRYRSTPFGLWAGVGIGSWGDRHHITLPVSYHPIQSIKASAVYRKRAHSKTFKIAPGLITYSEYVHYWTYCPEEEGWRISYLDKNPLIVLLLSYFQKYEQLDRNKFESFFETKNQRQLNRIWKMLVVSGIIMPYNFPHDVPSQSSVDVRINSALTVHHTIKQKFDQLVSEIGGLFVPVESGYLKEVKKWFRLHYDDRFVPIEQISHVYDFSSGTNHLNPEEVDENQRPSFSGLFHAEEEIDLSLHVESKPVDIRHLHFVFKLYDQDEIFIENIVCNREFAYSGRFSLDPAIKNIVSRQLGESPPALELVDLVLFESAKANFICRHSSLFEYAIYPFGKSMTPRHLGTEDLLLGMREEKLILFSKRLGKPVVPVVQHPLNPNQITHNLSRLYWEIGNQDQCRFSPYHQDIFQKSDYLPRLTWKGTILQGRRWRIQLENFHSKSFLNQFLTRRQLPCPLLAGHLDRELVLEWTDPIQMDFLWKELQRTKELLLYECPWVQKSPFKNESGEALYPQVIFSKAFKKWKIPSPGFLNRIGERNLDWVYVRIFVKDIGLHPFLIKSMPRILALLKQEFALRKWYYLIYQSPRTEIRLRILPTDPSVTSEIAFRLENRLRHSAWVEEYRPADYYPENEKYGSDEGAVDESESIFHRESELAIAECNPNLALPMLIWDEEERVVWTVERFSRLIQKCDKTELFFGYFRDWIKQIPIGDRKELSKRETRALSTYPDKTLEELDLVLADRNSDELLRVIPNHMHVCCNRLFPSGPVTQERRVIYGIYKNLGRMLHCARTKR